MKRVNNVGHASAAEIRLVSCSQGEIYYVLTRKAVKNVNLRIKPDGMVYVSAGYRVPLSFIEDFIRSREAFIRKAINRYASMERKGKALQSYETGEKLSFLGEELTLIVSGGQKDRIYAKDSYLYLIVKEDDFARKERCVKRWLKQMEQFIFDQVCREIYPIFKEYGISYPEIKIRTMKTMWGNCRPERGIITLNSRLIATPRKCIEYVVLHEFAHFIYPNHSADFYRLIAAYMPDYQVFRKELTNYQ